MLSKDLFTLCNSLIISSENKALNPKELSFLDKGVLDYLSSKNSFILNWYKKLNYSFSKINFTYYYNILEENASFIKLKLLIHTNFILNNLNLTSSSIDTYILILKKNLNFNKIIYLVCGEEDPSLYLKLKHANLNEVLSLSNINFLLKDFWTNNNLLISEIYSKFINELNFKDRVQTSFNVQDACSYAEKYAIRPNPEYKDFTDIGGDCTNYVSQILHAGGLKTNNTWYPYSSTWIRVKELYEYLLNYNLAHILPDNLGLDKGCIIQFLIPTTNRFSHTAFITHNIKGVDLLYCCHSYNKLNYPLGLIYPIRYKSMRSLMIN